MCTPTCALSSLGPAGFFVLYISILLSAGLSAAMEGRKGCGVQQDQSDTANSVASVDLDRQTEKARSLQQEKEKRREGGG